MSPKKDDPWKKLEYVSKIGLGENFELFGDIFNNIICFVNTVFHLGSALGLSQPLVSNHQQDQKPCNGPSVAESTTR